MGVGGKLVIAMLMAVSLLLVYTSIEFVPDDGEAVLFERHEPVRMLSPGWHLLSPFDQSVRVYSVEKSFSLEHREEHLFTRDREVFGLAYVLRWSICDVMRFSKLALPARDEIAAAGARLREAVQRALRIAMARQVHPDALSTDAIRMTINESVEDVGICVSEVRVTSAQN